MKSSLKPVVEGRGACRGRLLIVDDEELVRSVIRTVLVQQGYEVVEARDGEEAIAICREQDVRFDLALIDLHMPRMTGLQALERIREGDPGLTAIFLSGMLEEGELAESMERVQFVGKPFDNHELVQLVNGLVLGGRAAPPAS